MKSLSAFEEAMALSMFLDDGPLGGLNMMDFSVFEDSMTLLVFIYAMALNICR